MPKCALFHEAEFDIHQGFQGFVMEAAGTVECTMRLSSETERCSRSANPLLASVQSAVLTPSVKVWMLDDTRLGHSPLCISLEKPLPVEVIL